MRAKEIGTDDQKMTLSDELNDAFNAMFNSYNVADRKKREGKLNTINTNMTMKGNNEGNNEGFSK